MYASDEMLNAFDRWLRSDLSLCSLVRSGREGRRCVFSLSEDDRHGGEWV